MVRLPPNVRAVRLVGTLLGFDRPLSPVEVVPTRTLAHRVGYTQSKFEHRLGYIIF